MCFRRLKLAANLFSAPLSREELSTLWIESMDRTAKGQPVVGFSRAGLAFVYNANDCDIEDASDEEIDRTIRSVSELWTHEERIESLCRVYREFGFPSIDDVRGILDAVGLEVMDDWELQELILDSVDAAKASLIRITRVCEQLEDCELA